MRIKEHPVLDYERGTKICFTFNGKEIEAYRGETVAAALHAAGVWYYHDSSELERPRGLFCAIGHCSACLMTVDGIPNTKICVTDAVDGMVVESKRNHEVGDEI